MRKRTNSIFLILLVFLSSFVLFDSASAKTRVQLLGNFLIDNQTTSGGFVDCANGSSTEITEFTSYVNIYLLHRMNRFDDIDKTKAKNWFLDRFDVVYNSKLIPQTYFAYVGCRIVDAKLNETVVDPAVDAILDCQNATTKGFATKNSSIANIVDTYFAIEFFHWVKNQSVYNADDIADFVMSCWAEEGFSGSPGGKVNPADTYYAVKILKRISAFNQLTKEMKESMSKYLDGFYCNNKDYRDHYGGYSYTNDIPHSSVLLTFYCVGVQELIGGKLHKEETLHWLYDRQNPKDYGFCDVNEEPTMYPSSAIVSYYAVKSIFRLEEMGFDGRMSEDIWWLESDKWEVAGIIIGSIAGAILLIFIIWKLKNRV